MLLEHSLWIQSGNANPKYNSSAWIWSFYVPIFSKVWPFSQSEWSSLNVEMWRLKLSILSLMCDTRLSVMSWSHLLLMWSIWCASDAVGHAGLTNFLMSDNLASKLVVTVPFSWLLAKFWSWEVLSEGPGFCRFERFSCPWFKCCQNFDE